MAYIPTGPLATQYRAKIMMAQSLTVQELLGAADAEEALERIVCYTGYAADFDRPRLVISDLEDERGFLSELEFYIDNENVVTIEDQYQFARDKAGSILLEMIDLSGTGQLVDNTTYPRLEVATELNRTKQYIDTVEIPADERDDQGTGTEGLPLWVIVGEWKVR